MAIDKLQEKIRKLKNPSAITFSFEGTEDFEESCLLALTSLREIAPAVRFCFGSFALANKIDLLKKLLQEAKKRNFYVLLDAPELWTVSAAQQAANILFAGGGYVFDGLILSGYCGSDMLRPFVQKLGEKDLFTVIRSANKSAAELQDLLTGGRLVHTAAADVVYRMGESIVTRSGYSPIGAVASATSADSLRNLRAKYRGLFLIVDGYGTSGANAKNCANAFDRLGHGALVCAEYAFGGQEDALTFAERMKGNLLRYTNVL